MEIVLLGSGNTATVLGKILQSAGHSISQVYSRSPNHAKELASVLNAEATSEIKSLVADAGLYLLCVSDSALPDIAAQLRLNDRLVAHTAGSVSADILQPVSLNYGVLYPLQSLRKETQDFPEIPFLIDGNNETTIQELKSLAASISKRIQVADDLKRKQIHLAAVLSNNFSNYLFSITEEFCKRHQIDFELVMPLLGESFKRLSEGSPREMQTGPARRGDHATIQAHLELLKDQPAIQSLYGFLSRKILEYYGQKGLPVFFLLFVFGF